MKAALLTEPFRFELVELPLPPVGPEEMLVRVRRAGICGSDVHIYRGEYVRDQLPRVPGHEFAGEVVELGGKSAEFAVGDLVTADINIGCGRCARCRADDAMLCAEVSQIGIHRDGAFAEYVSVPLKQGIRLPAGVGAAIGALAEPVGCVTRSLHRCGMREGRSILVIGAGPMGMLHLQVARAMGASIAVVLEADPARAAIAGSLGADRVAARLDEARDSAADLTGDGGFDIVVECVGKTNLYEFGLSAVRPGGVLACFGLVQADLLAGISPYEMVLREKSMVGSVGANGQDMRKALDLLASGRVAAAPYCDKVFQLEEVNEAFRAFAVEKSALKVQLAP